MWSFGRVAPQSQPDAWVNFWEERDQECDDEGRVCWPRPIEDRRRGIIRHTAFTTMEPGRERALLVASHEWRRASDDTVLLTQRQTVTTYPKTDAGWFCDLQFELQAIGEPMLMLPHDEDDSNYASSPYGLACQFARELNGGVLLNSSGERGAACCASRANWCDYSSLLDDDETHHAQLGGWVGLTLMNHPHNPLHPSPFFALTGHTTVLSATPIANEPLVISHETPSVFRYRVFAHHGRGEAKSLDALYHAFVELHSNSEQPQ
jgi:hypothetical protein